MNDSPEKISPLRQRMIEDMRSAQARAADAERLHPCC